MTPENAKVIADFLAEGVRREQAVTLKVLEAVPNANLDFKPSEKCMSALDLAWHVANADIAMVEGAATGNFPFSPRPENVKTPADIVAYYKEHAPRVLALAQGMTGESAMKVYEPFPKFSMPGVIFLDLSMKHTIHHRGQLSSYLRPMGGKVPAIYGGSADEPMS